VLLYTPVIFLLSIKKLANTIGQNISSNGIHGSDGEMTPYFSKRFEILIPKSTFFSFSGFK
jgi:hypothetical protein